MYIHQNPVQFQNTFIHQYVLSKETHICRKRRIFVKRDVHLSKETYIFQKDLYLLKETYISNQMRLIFVKRDLNVSKGKQIHRTHTHTHTYTHASNRELYLHISEYYKSQKRCVYSRTFFRCCSTHGCGRG